MSTTTTTSGTPKSARPAARKVFGGLMGVMVALVMMGCPKPPPPPPPAPLPPPPPPPPPVSLESLGQDMKADARVTFSGGLEVEQDQEALGRAVVSLADALAKGDDTKLDTLLDARAKELLSELRNSGAWQDQTKQIESVRVVFVGGGVNFAESVTAQAAIATDPVALRAELEAVKDRLPFDFAEQMKEWTEKLTTPEGRKEIADQLQTTLDGMKASGSTNEAAQKRLEAMIKGLRAEGGPPGAEAGASFGTLIALQDPRGAYLTGWRAINIGDTWSFAGAPATPETRARAEAFDGIGMLGFQGVVVVKRTAGDKKPDDAGDDAADGDDGAPGADGDGGEGDKKDKPDDGGGGRKKSTPAGPVMVPGGG